MTLVKHVQIFSSFNQAYYYTNYCVLSVVKCYYKGCGIVFKPIIKFCHELLSCL